MMDINKVLEILNNGDYISLNESINNSNLCPYSETIYTVKLKEGGEIKIKQYTIFKLLKRQLFAYTIGLYVPEESKAVEQWSFQDKNDSLFKYVEDTFYYLYNAYSLSKMKDYSKYFPQ